jgi:hypothetical protein
MDSGAHLLGVGQLVEQLVQKREEGLAVVYAPATQPTQRAHGFYQVGLGRKGMYNK